MMIGSSRKERYRNMTPEQRERKRTMERAAARRRTESDPTWRDRDAAYNKKRRMNGKVKAYKADPRKMRVRGMVRNAIEQGRMIRGPCERCGIREDVQAHHENYDKVFEVMWLCSIHHAQRHREIADDIREHWVEGEKDD